MSCNSRDASKIVSYRYDNISRDVIDFEVEYFADIFFLRFWENQERIFDGILLIVIK